MNAQEIRERWSKATRGPWVADMRPVATECGADIGVCREHWRKWLEKEAQGVEQNG